MKDIELLRRLRSKRMKQYEEYHSCVSSVVRKEDENYRARARGYWDDEHKDEVYREQDRLALESSKAKKMDSWKDYFFACEDFKYAYDSSSWLTKKRIYWKTNPKFNPNPLGKVLEYLDNPVYCISVCIFWGTTTLASCLFLWSLFPIWIGFFGIVVCLSIISA